MDHVSIEIYFIKIIGNTVHLESSYYMTCTQGRGQALNYESCRYINIYIYTCVTKHPSNTKPGSNANKAMMQLFLHSKNRILSQLKPPPKCLKIMKHFSRKRS